MGVRKEPIVSVHAEDPTRQAEIDRFVVRLGERVDDLQDADLAGDFGRLSELSRRFEGEASRAGYPALAAQAHAVAEACTRKDAIAVRELLLELTELAQRVRLGHRSAA